MTNTTMITCPNCLTASICRTKPQKCLNQVLADRRRTREHNHPPFEDNPMSCRECFVIANGMETDWSSEMTTPETTRPRVGSTWRSSPSTSARSRIVVHEPPDLSASSESPASLSTPPELAMQLDRELAYLRKKQRKDERSKKKGVAEKLMGLFGEGQGW